MPHFWKSDVQYKRYKAERIYSDLKEDTRGPLQNLLDARFDVLRRHPDLLTVVIFFFNLFGVSIRLQLVISISVAR